MVQPVEQITPQQQIPQQPVQQPPLQPVQTPSIWKKAFFILVGVLLVGAIGYGGYYLGSNKKSNTIYPTPYMQVPTTVPTSVIPTTSVTPSSALKTITAGGVSSLKKYSIAIPSDWTIQQTKEQSEDVLDMTKNGYKIEILQGAVDGGVCAYPDYPSNAALIHNDYKTYTEFKDQDGMVYRRGLDGENAQKTGLRYAICSVYAGTFSNLTQYGIINIDTPPTADENMLKEIDSILATIKQS